MYDVEKDWWGGDIAQLFGAMPKEARMFINAAFYLSIPGGIMLGWIIQYWNTWS